MKNLLAFALSAIALSAVAAPLRFLSFNIWGDYFKNPVEDRTDGRSWRKRTAGLGCGVVCEVRPPYARDPADLVGESALREHEGGGDRNAAGRRDERASPRGRAEGLFEMAQELRQPRAPLLQREAVEGARPGTRLLPSPSPGREERDVGRLRGSYGRALVAKAHSRVGMRSAL